jgi:hypothetical protein
MYHHALLSSCETDLVHMLQFTWLGLTFLVLMVALEQTSRALHDQLRVEPLSFLLRLRALPRRKAALLQRHCNRGVRYNIHIVPHLHNSVRIA